MILYIQQTKTNFNMEWLVSKGDELICKAEAPFERGQFRTSFRYCDNREQSTYFNPMDTSFGRGLAERMSFKIFEAGGHIGHIVGRTQKTGKFFGAYPYYEFMYLGEEYRGYEVGFGSRGLFICFYKGDTLLAVADKQLRVVNFKDVYTAYIEDENIVPLFIPFLMYYDVTQHGDVMDIAVASIQHKRVDTIQKELIAKYDPSFIPRIQGLENTN